MVKGNNKVKDINKQDIIDLCFTLFFAYLKNIILKRFSENIFE